MKFHPPNASPIFVGGRMVIPGSFYEGSPPGLPATDMIQNGALPPEPPESTSIPRYEDITVPAMKSLLDEWGVDYSNHDKDKSTLYSFFVEEAMKQYGDA